MDNAQLAAGCHYAVCLPQQCVRAFRVEDVRQQHVGSNATAVATGSVRIRTHRCEPTSIGIDEPVDFALAFYSAHEVPDLHRMLGEIHGSLRPRGRLLVVVPIGHVTAKDFQAIISLAQEIGLREQGWKRAQNYFSARSDQINSSDPFFTPFHSEVRLRLVQANAGPSVGALMVFGEYV